jgi:D-serine deaminase-like pyridoxal phosphate-dependent protein
VVVARRASPYLGAMSNDDMRELSTPAAVVDLDRMERNLARMQDYAAAHGLGLRPHTKTHKAEWLGAEQVRRGALGLTVATPVEARRVGRATADLLVAYPALGPRAAAVAAVAAERRSLGAGHRTLVALDSVEAVRALQAAVAEGGSTDPLGILVELDVGMRRCGVPDAAAAVEVARACGDGAVSRGILFSPGHIREPVAEQDGALEALAGSVAAAVEALGDAGLAPEIVSGGSTPTAFRSHEIPHQTEIRPGTYVFNDRTTAAIGACDWDDCAYTILATVVSTAVAGQAVVDAGSKALSSDELRAPGYGGYGQLLDRPEVVVARVSEEHGVLDLSQTDWRPRIGERVRIIPNHVCVSVNLQLRIHGVRGGVVDRDWGLDARGW